MEIKVHYFLTIFALIILAVIVIKPATLRSYDQDGCGMFMSKMNCSMESRIQIR